MKQFLTIATVAALLLIAALIASKDSPPSPDNVFVPDTQPIVDAVSQPGEPVTTASVDGTVSLRGSISHGFVQSNGEREIFLALDLQAKETQELTRAPLNVAVVIDRSGSMHGQPWVFAKEATARLINELGPQDRLALVSYGSDVTIDFPSRLMTDENKHLYRQAVEDMRVGGGTNLSGGFERGFQEVSRWRNARTVNRVIMMTDGLANIGVTDPARLEGMSRDALRHGVSVTSVGFGADYNEDLMMGMAREGAGNYYYIDQPQSLARAFDQEMQTLRSSVARDAVVTIRPGDGYRLDRIFAWAHHQEGNALSVPLSAFASGESKNILARFTVAAGMDSDPQKAFELTLSYVDLLDKEDAKHKSIMLTSGVSSSASLYAASNVDVIGRVQQIEIATAMDEAMQFYSKGQIDEAERRLERTQVELQKNMKNHKFDRPERYEAAEEELKVIRRSVRSAPPSSAAGRQNVLFQRERSNQIQRNVDLF